MSAIAWAIWAVGWMAVGVAGDIFKQGYPGGMILFGVAIGLIGMIYATTGRMR